MNSHERIEHYQELLKICATKKEALEIAHKILGDWEEEISHIFSHTDDCINCRGLGIEFENING